MLKTEWLLRAERRARSLKVGVLIKFQCGKEGALLGILGTRHDPSVLYGVLELASRLGIDVMHISGNIDNECMAVKLLALIVPETCLGNDLHLRQLVENGKYSIILVGPHASTELDELFGVRMLGKRDSFSDISGNIKFAESPEPVPVFFSIPILERLSPAANVTAYVHTDRESIPGVIIKKGDRNCLVRIGPQIFRSTAFLLTQSGMRGSLKRQPSPDSYGRLPLTSTMVSQRGYLRTPAVDYYARILEVALLEIAASKSLPLIQKWIVPGPQRFCICLSHDVDYLAPKPLEMAVSLMFDIAAGDLRRSVARMILAFFYFLSGVFTRNRDQLALVPGRVHQALRGYEPYWRLEEICLSEARQGGTSSFFLLPNEDRKDSNYSILNLLVGNTIEHLSKAGFEICLHAGFSTAAKPANLGSQKRALERIVGTEVAGVRSHFLRFSYPDTFWDYVNAGFTYDSSIMFPEEVGYRASTCFPWMLFDMDTKRTLGLVEIPPIIMDRTLRQKKYMNLSPTSARSLCSTLLSQVAELHGVLTVIWHNSGLSVRPSEDRAWWAVYWYLLQEARRRGARIMNLGQFFSYYKTRQATKIVAYRGDDHCCEVTVESPQDFSTFALSVSLKSGRIREISCSGSTLPANYVTQIDQHRSIVTLPIASGRNVLSIRYA